MMPLHSAQDLNAQWMRDIARAKADPVFAAIERWRPLWAAFMTDCDIADGVACDAAVKISIGPAYDALRAIYKIQPTTPAGLLAMMTVMLGGRRRPSQPQRPRQSRRAGRRGTRPDRGLSLRQAHAGADAMSLVDLRPAAELFATLGQIDHDDGPFGDGIALTDSQPQDVRNIILDVARRLTDRALSIESMRRRLGAIVESLIGVADVLDGDPDLEDGAEQEAACEDEGAQCEDEGCPDDNGMADADGAGEQGFLHCGGFTARSIS